MATNIESLYTVESECNYNQKPNRYNNLCCRSQNRDRNKCRSIEIVVHSQLQIWIVINAVLKRSKPVSKFRIRVTHVSEDQACNSYRIEKISKIGIQYSLPWFASRIWINNAPKHCWVVGMSDPLALQILNFLGTS